MANSIGAEIFLEQTRHLIMFDGEIYEWKTCMRRSDMAHLFVNLSHILYTIESISCFFLLHVNYGIRRFHVCCVDLLNGVKRVYVLFITCSTNISNVLHNV